MRQRCKSATIKSGRRVKVGDAVRSIHGVDCVITGIWKQGADGTILETSPSPNPDYPHHNSGRASDQFSE